jgi:uncharacterized protein
MIYFVDGYNLLFKLFHCSKKLEIQRKVVIDFLQEKSSFLHINIHLIFDGYKQNKEFPNISYLNNLKVIYTPKDQTADEYILEQIFLSKNPNQIIVITSDNNLKIKAKDMHAQTKSIDDFVEWLTEKENKAKKKSSFEKENFIDTKKNIDRLLKIFEDKIKNNSKDWD